jgi:hypothetical protein
LQWFQGAFVQVRRNDNAGFDYRPADELRQSETNKQML